MSIPSIHYSRTDRRLPLLPISPQMRVDRECLLCSTWRGFLLLEKPSTFSDEQWDSMLDELESSLNISLRAEFADLSTELSSSGNSQIMNGTFCESDIENIPLYTSNALGISFDAARNAVRGFVLPLGKSSPEGTYQDSDRVRTYYKDMYPEEWGTDSTYPTVDVTTYGATGDGVTDDTAAIQSAIDTVSAGTTISFPAGTYRIVSQINVSKALRFTGSGATISLEGNNDAGIFYFYITVSNVRFTDLIFDGSSEPANADGTLAYRVLNVYGGGWPNQITDFRVHSCTFQNLNYSGVGVSAVAHAVFVVGAIRARVTSCTFDTITGSAINIRDANGVWLAHNYCDAVGYYNFHIQGSVQDIVALGNEFGSNSTPNYGGFLNSFGYNDNQECQGYSAWGNDIKGASTYGASVRILSFNGCEFVENIITGLCNTTRMFHVGTRIEGVIPVSIAPRRVLIARNVIIAASDIPISYGISNFDSTQNGVDWVTRHNEIDNSGGFSTGFGAAMDGYGKYGAITDNSFGTPAPIEATRIQSGVTNIEIARNT